MKNVRDIGQNLLSGIQDWPSSWKINQADIQIGVGILNTLTPFLQHLVGSGLTATTLRRHFSNIWLLGGEIIQQSYDDLELRSFSADDLILHFINEEGGPLSQHNPTEFDQKSFDGSCRKLHNFLLTKGT